MIGLVTQSNWSLAHEIFYHTCSWWFFFFFWFPCWYLWWLLLGFDGMMYLEWFLYLLFRNFMSFCVFFFFFAKWKKGVSGVGLLTSCHVTAISNTTCITRVLLWLSLEPLLSRCRMKTPTIKPHPVWLCPIVFIPSTLHLFDKMHQWLLSLHISFIWI